MKTKLLILAGLALVSSANASVVLNTFFGQATTSLGTIVPDGTLWALVVDNGDNTFAGGFGLGGSILNDAAGQAAFTTGQSLQVGGLIGSDTIFAMGGFNGVTQGQPGFSIDAIGPLTLGGQLTANKNAAFYFFPGVTYTTPGTYAVGIQVGGLNGGSDPNFEGGLSMVIPADGNTVNFGTLTADANGVATNFQAVNLVPEPSAALLGALGALGLLRRRRI